MPKASVQQSLPPMEVKPSHRVNGRSEEPSPLDVPLRMAKVKAGRFIRKAIGDRPLKEFGHEGLMSEVCSGAKVPDYLARIVADKDAKRDLGLALLEDDTDVIVTTTITVPHKKVV